MSFHIVSIADLCIDVLVNAQVKPEYGQVEKLVDDYSMDLGGSIGIFASQIAKLGGKISLVGSLGDDLQGKIVLQTLKDSGVNTDKIQISANEKTPLGLNLSCLGDRAMLTYLGTLNLIDASVFEENIFEEATHVHIGGYFLLNKLISAWPEQIKKLKQSGKTISLDTNWDPDQEWKTITDILPHVDVFLPNESEALSITGQDDISKAGSILATYCPLVVIKCGEKGAIVFTDIEVVEYPIPVRFLENLQILDTTGAGDNFDAGFLFNRLQNEKLSTCIELAFECAISSLKALGGVKMQVLQKQTAND